MIFMVFRKEQATCMVVRAAMVYRLAFSVGLDHLDITRASRLIIH